MQHRHEVVPVRLELNTLGHDRRRVGRLQYVIKVCSRVTEPGAGHVHGQSPLAMKYCSHSHRPVRELSAIEPESDTGPGGIEGHAKDVEGLLILPGNRPYSFQ